MTEHSEMSATGKHSYTDALYHLNDNDMTPFRYDYIKTVGGLLFIGTIAFIINFLLLASLLNISLLLQLHSYCYVVYYNC